MYMPSVFGESFLDDFFRFPEWNFEGERRVPTRAAVRREGLMRTDVKETDGAYELSIDLPGFEKGQVKAALENGYLTVSAERNEENDEKDKETGKYIRRERYIGSMSRSFYVGDHLNKEDLKAEFANGVLKITVPKKEAIPQKEEEKYLSIEG